MSTDNLKGVLTYKVPLLATDPAQDRILEEFLDKNHFKPAIDHINKRLKKTKTGEPWVRLSVMRNLMEFQKERLSQALSPKAESSGTMAVIVSSLTDLAPQFTRDPECVEAVDEISRGPWGSSFWKSCSDKNPTSEQIYDAWFNSQFRKEQYDEAAKACFAWRKAFPNKFHSLTWTFILCHFMASTNLTLDKKQIEMSKMMCIRLADQAVANTPTQDPKVVAISSEEDLELVVKIYLRHRKFQELLALLDDPAKGIASPFGNWNSAHEKLLLLHKCASEEQPEAGVQLEAYCRQLLEDVLIARTGSTSKQRWGLGDSGDNAVVYKHLTFWTKDSTYEATTALYEYLAKSGSLNAEIHMPALHASLGPTDEVVFEAIKRFWSKFAPLGRNMRMDILLQHHPDLLPRVIEFSYDFALQKSSAILPQPSIGDSLAQQKESLASARGRIASLLQALKLHYDLAVDFEDRFANHPRPDPRSDVMSVIMCAVDLWMRALAYETSKPTADNGLGDEALILAARALIFLDVDFPDDYPTALTWARILLQEVVELSKHNFRALILLVRVCLYQGAADMAMAYYQRLDIKNLQYITESAVMFRDLSLLCPKKSGGYDPLAVLRRMRDWADKRHERQVECVMEAVGNGNWVSAIESATLALKFTISPEAAMINLEIARMANRWQSEVNPALAASATSGLTQIITDLGFDNDNDEEENEEELVDPEDALGKEFPAENRRLNLSQSMEHGNINSALWNTIMAIQIRAVITSSTMPECAAKAENVACDPHLFFLWMLVVQVAMSPKTAAQGKRQRYPNARDDPNGEVKLLEIFDQLQEWVTSRDEWVTKDLPQIPEGCDGQLAVRFHALYDMLELTMDVCAWIAHGWAQYAPRALKVGGSAMAVKLHIFDWAKKCPPVPEGKELAGRLNTSFLDQHFQVLFAPDARKRVLEERLSTFAKSKERTLDALKARSQDGHIEAWNERITAMVSNQVGKLP